MWYRTFCDYKGYVRAIYNDEWCAGDIVAYTQDIDWGNCYHIGNGQYLKAKDAMGLSASAAVISSALALFASQF